MSEYSTPDNLEVLLDVFNSKHTKAWDRLSGAVRPQIFSHGDECHPLIMLADMVAFLTDQKLYKQYLHLTPPNLDSIWREYDFSVTTLFFNQKSLPFYKWYDNDMIDLASYLAHPIVFLAIDDIEGDLGGDARPDAEIEYPANTPRKFNQAIKKSPVYDAAVTHAFRIGGCMKFYSRTEDVSVVRDGDVFVYVGDKSKMIGMTLQQGCRINVLSGVELRDLVEKGNH
ncbi:MAG: hypothetical protein MPJ08_05630 [Nitrosopumilus sp.]|nr:hypothetical protein [Nitrosopumilus sp.]